MTLLILQAFFSNFETTFYGNPKHCYVIQIVANTFLKDEPLFPTGGNVAFFSGLKWTYLGFGVSEGVKFFLL